MWHTYTPILVGVTSLVSEILLLSKTAKFPFLTMDYSPWSLKKFNQSELVQKIHASMNTCDMHATNFGERDLFGFRDTATFKNGQISLSVHGHQKIQWI